MPKESDPLLSRTKSLMRQLHIQARKGLGQHFLVDSASLEASIDAAELSRSDNVIEVGPGLGVLTEQLSQTSGQVIAIELDQRISSLLQKRVSRLQNVTILNANILEVDISEVLQQTLSRPSFDYKVVANLPYYVAAPILRHFLEAKIKPQRMVVMVQKEVAESIVAASGKMSLLGIGVQIYGKPSIVKYVPAESFYPPPKVGSAIIRIDVYEQPVVDVDITGFFRVVKAGFSAPRKQLRNSLALGLSISPDKAVELLNMAEISSQRRAETLTLKEWAELFNCVANTISIEN
ncbi:16S rRNA (adenine(1518)-N(6)/adenine(1519)-N(6))-dimethyltransferase RsmA [Chloroflexota bacterium]